MKILAVTALVLLGAAPAAATTPDLKTSTDHSDTGSYTLSWEANGQDVTVEEATESDFSNARILYEGPDRSSVVSGRLDGTYYYRIRYEDGDWGEAVQVSVTHHSLRNATSFLAVGAVVFLATAGLIIDGHRRHRREFRRDAGVSL